MTRSPRSRRSRPTRARTTAKGRSGPVITFLLVASLGILMVGCGGSNANPEAEEYTFTAEDVEKFQELVNEENEQQSTGTGVQRLALTGGSGALVGLTSEEQRLYDAIRASGVSFEENIYKVVNEFVNIRSEASVRSAEIARLILGDQVELIEFVNGIWAKVRLSDGKEGYVSHRYISKLSTEDSLAEDKKPYENRYYVDFSFLNVRAQANSGSEKLGQLPGQAFVTPLSIDGEWARIAFEGKEGYVSTKYLKRFEPNFTVRQEKFRLPIFSYDLTEEGMTDALVRHIASMQDQEISVLTLRDFYELLVFQEERDVRLDPKSVVLAVKGLNKENYKEVSDVLRASNQAATFFIETRNLGPEGLTENRILTLAANGHDLQTSGHSGKDLRSMTNAQVELELQQGRLLLEEITGETVLGVLYPEGGVNERVMNKAREIGYLFGVGAAPNSTFMRDELLRLPSFPISQSMSAEEITKIIVGE